MTDSGNNLFLKMENRYSAAQINKGFHTFKKHLYSYLYLEKHNLQTGVHIGFRMKTFDVNILFVNNINLNGHDNLFLFTISDPEHVCSVDSIEQCSYQYNTSNSTVRANENQISSKQLCMACLQPHSSCCMQNSTIHWFNLYLIFHGHFCISFYPQLPTI